MKSVGEVMGIGRNFAEALQKAVRMVTEDALGLVVELVSLFSWATSQTFAGTNDTRLYDVFDAFREGISLAMIHRSIAIDCWFCENAKRWSRSKKVSANGSLARKKALPEEITLRLWKSFGFSMIRLQDFLLQKSRKFHQRSSARKVRQSRTQEFARGFTSTQENWHDCRRISDKSKLSLFLLCRHPWWSRPMKTMEAILF